MFPSVMAYLTVPFGPSSRSTALMEIRMALSVPGPSSNVTSCCCCWKTGALSFSSRMVTYTVVVACGQTGIHLESWEEEMKGTRYELCI